MNVGSESFGVSLGNYQQHNSIYFQINSRKGSNRYIAEKSIEQGAWIFWVVQIDHSSQIAIYKNGRKLTTGYYHLNQIRDELEALDTKSNYLGKSNVPSDEYFQGAIDNFKIYNKNFSDAEIFDKYTQCKI